MTAKQFPAGLVIDSSVALKWYLDEDKSQHARKIYDAVKSGVLLAVAPEYLLVEVANVLLKHYKIPAVEIIKVINDLHNLGIEYIAQNIIRFDQLIATASTHKLAIYDTLFLECTHISGYKLITADVVLAKADPKRTILL